MPIYQNTTDPLPLYVPSASANYDGDPSLTGLTGTIEYAGQPAKPIAGTIKPGSRGVYWFYPATSDFNLPGKAVLLLNVPIPDVAIPFEYTIEPLPATLASVVTQLATLISLMERLVTAERA